MEDVRWREGCQRASIEGVKIDMTGVKSDRRASDRKKGIRRRVRVLDRGKRHQM